MIARVYETDPVVFVDMDGVLADFDKHAAKLLGMEPQRYEDLNGPQKFWKDLWTCDPNFYINLEPMPDAESLWYGVNLLAWNPPVILTGIPKDEKSISQKLAWAHEHFPAAEVITCKSREKCKYCAPGDVLIDDFTKYKSLWEQAGGKYIVHRTAEQSLSELDAYFHGAYV